MIQWILKQRLQDRLPHLEGEPRGTGLLPHQLINGLREVQNQHTKRMIAMQDQIDVLLAKIDSIYTNQEH